MRTLMTRMQTAARPLLLVWCAAVLSGGPLASETTEPLVWEWVNPQPPVESFVDIAWFANRFVGIGNHGTIVTSSDGVAWEQQPTRHHQGGAVRLFDLLVVDGTIFAFGVTIPPTDELPHAIPLVCTSTDGVSWTIQEAVSEFSGFKQVAHNGTLFVADFGSALAWSDDGVSWTRSLALPTVSIGGGPVWGDGFFYALDYRGEVVYRSADGREWEERAGPGGMWTQLVWYAGHLYAPSGGGVARSTDGTQWEPVLATAQDEFVYQLSTVEGGVIALGRPADHDALLWHTSDGTTWERVALPAAHSDDGGLFDFLIAATASSQTIVAVGSWGRIVTNAGGNWRVVSENDGILLASVAWSGDEYVAVGAAGQALRSGDGKHWQREAIPINHFLESIVWVQDRFVAVGSGGAIVTSPDGRSWSLEQEGAPLLLEVITNSRVTLAVGAAGTVLRATTDLSSWEQIDTGTDATITSGIWDGTRFLLVNVAGHLLESADGSNWESRTIAPDVPLLDIAAGGERYLIVGWGGGFVGTYFVSDDAQTWEAATSNAPFGLYGQQGHTITWTGDEFVIAGSRGAFLRTPNGKHWTQDIPPAHDLFNTRFTDILTTSTQVIATHQAGYIVRALNPCVPSDTALCLNNGRFRVTITWRDFQNNTGDGHVVPIGATDSGLFWFFNETNWELLIKVLDGCAINNRFWVFAAATTNVHYTLTLTDTHIGATKTYTNPLGTAAPAITDTSAFATCQ